MECKIIQFITDLFSSLGTVENLVWCNSEVWEYFSDSSGIHTTVRSHIPLTASMYIHFAHWDKHRKADSAGLLSASETHMAETKTYSPLHWSPCRSRPHSRDPQWSQKVRTLKLWMLNLCGTLTLNLWDPTNCNKKEDTSCHPPEPKIHPLVYKVRFSRVKLVKKLLHQLYIYTDVDQHLAACILLLFHPCALGDDQLMATLMDHTGANCRRRTHMQA